MSDLGDEMREAVRERDTLRAEVARLQAEVAESNSAFRLVEESYQLVEKHNQALFADNIRLQLLNHCEVERLTDTLNLKQLALESELVSRKKAEARAKRLAERDRETTIGLSVVVPMLLKNYNVEGELKDLLVQLVARGAALAAPPAPASKKEDAT